jgi:hypothetical protein
VYRDKKLSVSLCVFRAPLLRHQVQSYALHLHINLVSQVALICTHGKDRVVSIPPLEAWGFTVPHHRWNKKMVVREFSVEGKV